jgi:hypothetical protein
MFQPLSRLNSTTVEIDNQNCVTVRICECLFCASRSNIRHAAVFEYGSSCFVHYMLCGSCCRERGRLLRNKSLGLKFFNIRLTKRITEILERSSELTKQATTLYGSAQRQ